MQSGLPARWRRLQDAYRDPARLGANAASCFVRIAVGTDLAAEALRTQWLDMARKLFERLVTVLDRTKADARIALSLGWMQLTQGDHSLAVALLVESDRRPKSPWIIGLIRPVINLDQGRRLDTTKLHAVGIAPAIGRNHIEAPQPANADVDLLCLNLETGWPEPIWQMFCISPRRKHDIATCTYYP